MTNFVDKVEALKKKAEKATKGIWARGSLLDTPQTRKWPEPMRKSVQHDEERRIFGRGRIHLCTMQENVPEWHQNAEYIAAASPDFILELCDKALEAERLQAEIARLKGDR